MENNNSTFLSTFVTMENSTFKEKTSSPLTPKVKAKPDGCPYLLTWKTSIKNKPTKISSSISSTLKKLSGIPVKSNKFKLKMMFMSLSSETQKQKSTVLFSTVQVLKQNLWIILNGQELMKTQFISQKQLAIWQKRFQDVLQCLLTLWFLHGEDISK